MASRLPQGKPPWHGTEEVKQWIQQLEKHGTPYAVDSFGGRSRIASLVGDRYHPAAHPDDGTPLGPTYFRVGHLSGT